VLNLQSNLDPDRQDFLDRVAGVSNRISTLRQQIALYRQQLRSTVDPEFAATYGRELAAAQHELACLLDRRRPSVKALLGR
jgi:hypothetical protein